MKVLIRWISVELSYKRTTQDTGNVNVHIQYVYNVHVLVYVIMNVLCTCTCNNVSFLFLSLPPLSFSSFSPPFPPSLPFSPLPPSLPPYRLDAGTFGTMGVGTGFAIAAAVCTSSRPLVSRRKPHPPVYCIQGNSAFGFSGMEIETAYRYLRVKYCEEMFLFLV